MLKPSARTLARRCWDGFRTWYQSPSGLTLLLMAGGLAGVLGYVTQPLLRATRVAGCLPADPARLRTHVKTLCEDLKARGWRTPLGLDGAARYIANHLRDAGAEVAEQVFQVQGQTYRNVSARFGPANGERIILGAHYDTFNGFPGADDNTSGVAALLELGRLLGQKAPRVPVELVAYTLEEPPFFRSQDMGSARHAEALRLAGEKVRVMISIEMIGTFSDDPDSQHFPLPGVGLLYPSRGNFIAVIGGIGDGTLVRRVKAGMAANCTVPVHSMNAPRAIIGIDYSDHRSYWERGFPAVMVTDTAFFRNPRYHTPRDVPERLDYARMAQVVQGLYGAVEAFSAH